MSLHEPTHKVLCFGPFEANLQTQELKKQGVPLRLPRQSFQILAMLVQRPGQLIPRDELQHSLWPSDTFVDFEKGLNAAINRLRETLGDSAENPRYVETLPRRGYRFIALVENPGAELRERGRLAESHRTPKWTWRFASTKRLALLSSFLGFLVLAVFILRSAPWSSPPIPRVIDSVQITKDGSPKDYFYLRLLSDGTRLYFEESLPEGVALVQVSTQGGETGRIPSTLQEPVVDDVSPARSELLVGGGAFKGVNLERPLWVLPLPAGSPHRVGGILAHDACWAPDGRHMAFVDDRDLFVAKPDGSEVRKLATFDGVPAWLRFSPDGTRLRFAILGHSPHPEESDIMEIGADGSRLHHLPIHGREGTWSADGRYYFYTSGRDIWVLPERRFIFGKVGLATPLQLTAGPLAFSAPAPSADGMHLFVIGHQKRVELVHYESRSKQFAPFLGGISAGELEVSPDGQWVVYTTYPESTLWRSKLDGSDRLQLTFAPMNAHEPRWSPDGKQILFTDVPFKLFVVPAEGGTPQQLMPGDHPNEIGAGAWLPDGNSIVFVRSMGCPDLASSCAVENEAIYLLDLKTQQVSKLTGSDSLFACRVSRNGRYLIATRTNQNELMLYDFHTRRWSDLARGSHGAVAWSHDSRFVYLDLKPGAQPGELVRISVPDGKMERVLDLRDVTVGGFWPGWISLLPDDSPQLMLDKSTQEIYRLDLQFR
jgi:Tol biopolymer transport system component/DNA-binding winged helix-turn-helix (wHTH) protein